MDLIVIGGGAAGLMAAGTAAKRGLKVTLIERNEKLARKVGITAGMSLALEAILINLTIKKLVGRTRPYVVNEAIEYITKRPSDNSFPSGHTGCMFAVASVLFYMMPKKVGIPAMIVASLVGISRLYVGVHYPTDILGGVAVGAAAGTGCKKHHSSKKC